MNSILLGLCVLNLLLNFLILAAIGRLSLNQTDGLNGLIVGHNWVAGRLQTLSKTIENALECLLTLDSKVFESSTVEVNE